MLYHNCIDQVFCDWHNDSANVDQLCAEIKTWLIKAGQKSVGYKTYKNGRHFWGNEVEKLIKVHHQADRLYHIWANHPNCSADLLQVLWDDYLLKREKVAAKVNENIISQKYTPLPEMLQLLQVTLEPTAEC